MASVDNENENKSQKFVWDVDSEVQLFYAMAGHKPVGVNKYFNMICIWEKLSNSITKEVTSEDIWSHLDTLYDLQLLDETETPPFPNELTDFALPDDEFNTLIKQKCKDPVIYEQLEESPKVSTPKNVTRGTASKESTPKGSVKKELTVKSRKESSSSTDTHVTSKSDKEYSSRRRDSRDSNASSTRESSTGRKSWTGRDKSSRASSGSTNWESTEELCEPRRGRRSTRPPPPTTTPARRRRT